MRRQRSWSSGCRRQPCRGHRQPQGEAHRSHAQHRQALYFFRREGDRQAPESVAHTASSSDGSSLPSTSLCSNSNARFARFCADAATPPVITRRMRRASTCRAPLFTRMSLVVKDHAVTDPWQQACSVGMLHIKGLFPARR